MINLRAADLGDAPAVADLWNGMIRDTLATFTTELKTAEEIAQLMQARPGAFWIAEAEGCAGFATFGPFRSGPGYRATFEHTIILAPGQQRQGTGRALMETLMKGAKDQGCHVLVAGISSANPGAVAFHAALGFSQSAHMPQVGRKKGQWLDLILMQKTISAS